MCLAAELLPCIKSTWGLLENQQITMVSPGTKLKTFVKGRLRNDSFHLSGDLYLDKVPAINKVLQTILLLTAH